MGKVVNLRWASHHQDLVTGIWNLFQEKYKTDFEVSLNGSYVSTHQIVMSIFCPAIKNATNNTLILGEKPSVTKQDLDSIIEFLYCGEVRVEASRLQAVKSLADQLGFKVLSQLIAQSLKALERKSSSSSKQVKSEPTVTKGIVYKSSLRIMPDRLMKRRSTARCGTSGGTEFIKLPTKTVATIKGLSKEPNLNKTPSKSAVKKSEKVVEEPSIKFDDSDNLVPIAAAVVATDDDPNNAVQQPFKREPRCRDDLCLESFNPQTFEFICKQCSKGFAKANDLYNHLRVHEQPKIRYECQHCEYKTNNRTCFGGHMINRHQMDLHGNLRPKDLKCPHCSYMCSVNFQLKNHIYLVHSVKRKVCESCGYRCQSKATLEKHKRLVHSSAKPLMCETCGYRAKIFADLHRHMRVHFCSKVTCEICGASVSANHLSVHKKIHSSSPKPFACHLCTFTSWKNWNLKVHLRSVHQKEPDRQKMDLVAE